MAALLELVKLFSCKRKAEKEFFKLPISNKRRNVFFFEFFDRHTFLKNLLYLLENSFVCSLRQRVCPVCNQSRFLRLAGRRQSTSALFLSMNDFAVSYLHQLQPPCCYVWRLTASIFVSRSHQFSALALATDQNS